MAADDDNEDEDQEGGAAGAKAPRKPFNPQLILALGNTVLVMAALGTLAYTKLLFERPAIVEEVEIEKKQEELKTAPPITEPVIVKFDQLTLNIAMTQGKAHYVTVALAVECRDSEVAALVQKRKALFVDRVIASLGRRQMTELNTIQGKLMLKTELMRDFNALGNAGGVTDLYFSNFVLQ